VSSKEVGRTPLSTSCNEAALGVCGLPGVVLQLQPPTRFQETGQQHII
jgi:hypothetical protein